MKKAFLALSLMLAGQAALVETALAQSPYKFVVDPSLANEFQARTSTSYLKPPSSGSNAQTSAILTSGVTVGANISDLNVVSLNLVKSTLSDYGHQTLSLASWSDLAIQTMSFMFLSAQGSFKVSPPDRPCRICAVIGTDSLPAGSLCRFYGNIPVQWEHDGPVPVSVNGRNFTLKAFVNNTEMASMTIQVSGGNVAVTKKILNVTTNETKALNTSSTTFLFDLPAKIGDQVRIEFDSQNEVYGSVIGPSQNHDNFKYNIDLSVGPP